MADKPERSKKVAKNIVAPLAAKAKGGGPGDDDDDDGHDEGSEPEGKDNPKGEAKADAAKGDPPKGEAAKDAPKADAPKAEAPKPGGDAQAAKAADKSAEKPPEAAKTEAKPPEASKANGSNGAPENEDPNAPSAPPGPAGGGDHRAMIGSENGQECFVEVRRDGTRLVIREGKVGVRGETRVKEYGDEGRAGTAFAIFVSETGARGFRNIR